MAELGSIVDFLENAFECSAEEVLAVMERNPSWVDNLRGEILDLLEFTWMGPKLEHNQEWEEPGELWPVLPRTSESVIALSAPTDARPLGPEQSITYAVREEAQSLLLYAHGLHLPNPFRPHDNTEDWVTSKTPNDAMRFRRSVAYIAALAPLIRSGVVRIFEPDVAPPLEEMFERDEKLVDVAISIALGLRYYERNSNLHQGNLRRAGDILLSRALEHLGNLAAQTVHDRNTIFFQTRYDAAATAAMLNYLSTAASSSSLPSKPGPISPDHVRLAQLADLRLPGLNALKLRDMVSIRSDASFGIFRSDMAAALTAVGDDLLNGQTSEAHRVVAEHMDAGLATLNARARRSTVLDSLSGGVVGWSVGATITQSTAGIGAALGVVMGRSGTDLIRKWPSAGQRALRSHYVELGTSNLPRNVRPEPVDFTRGTQFFLNPDGQVKE